MKFYLSWVTIFLILINFTLFVQHKGSFGTSLPSIELEIWDKIMMIMSMIG